MSVETEAAPVHRALWRRILRRRIWENLATVIIGVGVVMLMQPVSLWLYGYSLITTPTPMITVARFSQMRRRRMRRHSGRWTGAASISTLIAAPPRR